MSTAPRIRRLDTWLTNTVASPDGWATIKPFLFVRLTAEDGTIGWGEAFTLPCREAGVAAIVHALGADMIARRIGAPAAFRTRAGAIADKHRGLDYAAATSALEMALWDLEGRAAGKPLCELLGGSAAARIPLYANTWSEKTWSDPAPAEAALAERVEALLTAGFRAVKLYPLQNRTPAEGAACVATIRRRIGETVPLMLDLASPDDPGLARQLAPLVAPYAPYWFEEPCDGALVGELAAIRAETGLRIVTGEKQCGLPHFTDVIARRAADILNPDIAGVGGVLDMMEIGAAAEAAGVALSPHCWNSMTVAAAAMLHVCSALPNADHGEIYPDYIAFGERFADPGFRMENGAAVLSGAPGLGVDIDVRALSELASCHTTQA